MAALVTESKWRGSSAVPQKCHHLVSQWLERTRSQQRRQKTIFQLWFQTNTICICTWFLAQVLPGDTDLDLLSCYENQNQTNKQKKNTEKWIGEGTRGQISVSQQQSGDISKCVLSARSLHRNVYERQSSCYPKPYSERWRRPHTPEWTIPFGLHKQQQKATKLETYPTGMRLQSCGASQEHSLSPILIKIAFWLSVYSHYYWMKNLLLWYSPCLPEKYFYVLLIKYSNTVHVIFGKKINNNLYT